jgi:uncharacterized membrane protein
LEIKLKNFLLEKPREEMLKALKQHIYGAVFGFIGAIISIFVTGTLLPLALWGICWLPIVSAIYAVIWYLPMVKPCWYVVRTHATTTVTKVKNLCKMVCGHFKK